MHRLSVMTLGLSLLLAQATEKQAHATAIRYTIAFTLTGVTYDPMGEPWVNPPEGCIDCYKFLPLVGDLFTGSIAFDDSINAASGNLGGERPRQMAGQCRGAHAASGRQERTQIWKRRRRAAAFRELLRRGVASNSTTPNQGNNANTDE